MYIETNGGPKGNQLTRHNYKELVTSTQDRTSRIPEWGTQLKAFERSKKTAFTLAFLPIGGYSNQCFLGKAV